MGGGRHRCESGGKPRSRGWRGQAAAKRRQHGPQAKRVAVPHRRGRASPVPIPATLEAARLHAEPRSTSSNTPLQLRFWVAKPFPQLGELRAHPVSCHSRIVDKLADYAASADAATDGHVAK